jgi:probable F420-dependent oxidoreductase
MRVGIFAFSTDRGLTPTRLATEVEARGFDALLFPEHSHIPVSRRTAYPESYGGGVLPDFYQRTYDPFVTCALAAAVTDRIKIGTGICLMALREPIHTAKLVASVDLASEGRFQFGVGFGWNADEFENLGIPFKGRHELVREKVALMRELWTEDVASYQGERVSMEPSWAWPKPAQKPWPPVMLGGNGPLTMSHAARWADAWYPSPPLNDPLLEKSIPEFKRMVEEAGRDPETVPVGCAPADPSPADLEAFARNGVSFVNIAMATNSESDDLARLDAAAQNAREYLV